MKKQRKLQQNNKGGFSGSLTIRKYKDGKLISTQEEKNLIVSSSGYGRNLVIRQLSGDTTYGIEIDSASIGTGTTTPTDSDTALATSTLASIPVADVTVTNDTTVFEFFITDGELADGTYNEFALFIGSQLFTRSVFTSSYSKSTGEDTIVDYTITLSAS